MTSKVSRYQDITCYFQNHGMLLGLQELQCMSRNHSTIPQEHELEDDLVQSIWLKGGFKNAKQIYFCHGYREHQSSMGKTINAQRAYLDRFVLQWEAATMHGNPAEPNEVHISGDMNIDIHGGRWLDADYALLSLSKLVLSSLHAV